MKKLIEVLIKNYDRITKKYFFGKQEIININFQELVVLLKDLPFNSEKFPVPVQIITHDLIIKRLNEDFYTYEYNRLFPYNISLSKKKFKLNEFNKIFNNKKPKLVEYLKSYVYVGFIYILWIYFVSANSNSIFILIGQNFGTMTINSFLLWLLLVSIGGSLYFIYDSIIKLSRQNNKIPLKYSKPSDYIVKKNDLNHFFLFTGQLFYFFLLYYLYFAHANLVLVEEKLNTFLMFLIPGSIIAVHYLAIAVKLFVSNSKIKNKVLAFSYALLQNINVQRAEQELNLKIVIDIENSRNFTFGFVAKILGSLALLLAILPNISFNP